MEKFSALVDVFEQVAQCNRRTAKTAYMAVYCRQAATTKMYDQIYLLQGRLYPEWDSRKLNVASQTMIKALSQASGRDIREIEKLWKLHGDLGDVAEQVISRRVQSTLFSTQLHTRRVIDLLRKIPDTSGQKSVQAKISVISDLLSGASGLEAKYITRIVLEVMRIGGSQAVVRDALLWSAFPGIVKILYPDESVLDSLIDRKTLPISSMEQFNEITNKQIHYTNLVCDDALLAREIINKVNESISRAQDISNDIAKTTKVLYEQGMKGVKHIEPIIGQPLKVMLAQLAKSIDNGIAKVGSPAALEYKYDGFRIQIHKQGDQVWLYTRRLEQVTEQFPDVVQAVRKHIRCQSGIFDAEVVGYDVSSTQYLPFQKILQRIKRKYDIQRLVQQLPVEVNVFDVMVHENKSVLDIPFIERRKLVVDSINPCDRVLVASRILVTEDTDEATVFYNRSLDAGNEGVMIKSLTMPYRCGSRVGSMVKVKPLMETLDVIVVGANWGEGKRSAWLTSFVIGCVDDQGDIVELGNVSTGLKELESEGTTFQEMTTLLTPLIIEEKGKTIKVKPQVIIEVAFEEIQKSPVTGSGYALRFPRFVRLREDRTSDQATTLLMVEELYGGQ